MPALPEFNKLLREAENALHNSDMFDSIEASPEMAKRIEDEYQKAVRDLLDFVIRNYSEIQNDLKGLAALSILARKDES